MTISSTRFQQNVGYYLKLAESGTVVEILKSKPTQSRYQLKVVTEKKESISRKKLEVFFKKVEANPDKFDFYGRNAVKFVREIRE